MALPAGRYGVTKNQLLKIKKLPMNTIKLIEELTEKFDLLGSAAFKNSTSVVTDSSDLVESGAVKNIVGWGNKNLLGIKGETFRNTTGNIMVTPTGMRSEKVPCKPNDTFTAYSSIEIGGSGGITARRYNANGEYLGNLSFIGPNDTGFVSKTVPNDAYFLGFSAYDVLDNNGVERGNFMVGRGTFNTYEPYHASVEESLAEKCDNSTIAPTENGTTASQAYAVGEHFIRNGAFCTVTQAISQGGTLTEGTNYTSGDVASELDVVDITSEFTFVQDFTWDSGWTKIYKIGNKIKGCMRFTAPSTLNTAVTLVSVPEKYRSSKSSNTFLGILSETWSGTAKGCALLSSGIYCPDTSNLTSSTVIVAFEYLL